MDNRHARQGRITEARRQMAREIFTSNKAAVAVLSELAPLELNIRRYLPPQGYPSPNCAEAVLAMHIVDVGSEISTARRRPDGQVEIGGSRSNVLCMSCWQALHDWPMYAVTQELLDAMLLTDPPDDIRWQELDWPLPAITFLLPDSARIREYLHSPDAVPVLSMGRLDRPPPNAPVTLDTLFGKVRMPDGSVKRDMVVLTYWDHKEQALMFHDLVAKPEWTLASTMGMGAARLNPAKEMEVSDLYEAVLEDVDLERMHRAAKLGINLLAFMLSTYSPLLEESSVVRKASIKKSGKQKRDALFGVRWLGEGYRLHRHPLGGHHASPRGHWRRGHWRSQPYGPGRSLRMPRLIQPVFVNPEDGEK